MANLYTKASFFINVPAGTEIRRLKLVMAIIQLIHDVAEFDDEDVDKYIESFVATTPAIDSPDGVAGLIKIVEDNLGELEDDSLGFSWSIESKSKDKDVIWIHHGTESIIIDSAVKCIQVLAIAVPALQASAPWYATWANTCSIPRVDEFSGGGVVFDHEHAEWIDTSMWKHTMLGNFKTIKAAQAPLSGGQ